MTPQTDLYLAPGCPRGPVGFTGAGSLTAGLGMFLALRQQRGQVIDLLMEPRQEACAVAFWLRARPPAEPSLLWLAMLHAQ